MSNASIRKRLIGRLLVGMVAISAISNVGLYLYLREELLEQYDEALLTEARAVAGMLSSEDIDEDLPALIDRSFPRMHLGAQESGFLQVWDDSGAVVLRSPSLAGRDMAAAPTAGRVDKPVVLDLTLPDGSAGRATTLSFQPPLDDETARASQPAQRTCVLMLGELREELDETLSHLALALSLSGGALTAAAVALVVLGVRRELKPLNEFSEQMARVDANTLAYRFAETGLSEELRPISRRLNDLLARLDESFNRERRFSANVAHELRTPIAELRSMIEVAIKWPPDEPGVARLHAGILEVAQRMSRLVEAMLSLIRLQQTPVPAATERHDLAELVVSAWAPHAALARERGLEQACRIAPGICVTGDRTMLEALLSNVLGNAVQHATPGTRITCDVALEEHAGVSLTISNATADLQPEDLARLGEPFWRKDAARTRGEHLGLGLSLVRDYAKALQIDSRFAMPKPGTFEVELRWRP